ncbi:MAG: hypothetical protein E6H01_00295 [Bacillati bacterium ANGP1]|uniref:Gfo/Idh/MocA-like oxidoreductase C-terminal domain-containing protein n=1 Tax=Candidatus Segetimicrobium genomatis TaxID=2569760 RepID=A0A537LFV6_9BACT|nr:MAG: hypothetical protein E6H01_00295 [Terrabacteria group bacterium ANGP1]
MTIALEETRIVRYEIEGEPKRQIPPGAAVTAAQSPTALGRDEFTAQYRAVVASLQEGRAPPVSGEEARRAMATVLAIYEASRSGRPVAF